MIELFKTNVTDINAKECLIHFLAQFFPNCRITIDLHDCDKVLRLEGINVQTETVKQLVREKGFHCSELD
ncbi:hypothetical protein WG954_12435 [Lacibacter sp. H375]|uniref:hypothetical protein n=1 Tax=Lacibacter sp. H375 TaxID=3133424 RepID=UPI0030BFD745